MSARRLIISDLHFGSGDDLLASADARERVEPELAWADELVVNGDLFELVFASVEQAVAAARPFLALADRHVRRIHYIPGNHDHHLVALARDERRLAGAPGGGEPGGAGAPAAAAVPPAARLLRALCPTAEIVTAYPACELDGIAFTHGHYIDAHVHSSMNNLAWQLTGAARPPRLAIDDYEALVAPLYELMYAIANLPSGRRAQQRFERWLAGVAAVAHAPRHASQRLAALVHGSGAGGDGRLLGADDAPTAQVLGAMQAVCDDLDIRPRTVVFGHTHAALAGVCTPDGRHRLFNSGAWVLDRRGRSDHGWPRRPGTVLRATGGELELRGLLDDCDERDLARMLDEPPRRAAA